MKKNIEVILDTNTGGGCGCNCGCDGSSVVKDMNDLFDGLSSYKFNTELGIELLPISDIESDELINKINGLLSNTNAAFRVNEDNVEETLSNMLPMVTLDGTILTAYGVPTLNQVVMEVEKNLQ